VATIHTVSNQYSIKILLVVPGELHFLEREALIKIAQAPEDI